MRTLVLALTLLLSSSCGGGGADRDDPKPQPARLWAAVDASADSTVAPHSVLLRSDDAGAHWETAFTADHLLFGLAFTDADHGTAVGDGLVLRTTDGGTSWTPTRVVATDQLHAVTFASSTHGLAVGATAEDGFVTGTPLVLETTDGGEHWESVAIPPQPAGNLGELNDVCFDAAGSAFVVGAAFAAGATTTSEPLAFRVDARGWTDVSDRFSAALVGVSCASDTLWVLEYGGPLRSSTDGITWTTRSVTAGGVTPYVTDVAFLDADHGWITGTRGILIGRIVFPTPVLFRTDDGGDTWTDASLVQESPPIGIFHALGVASDGTGAVAGGERSGSAFAIRADDDATEQLALPPDLGPVRSMTIVPLS